MFRGTIKPNSLVIATFSADFSNSGSAAIVTSYGPETGEPISRSAVVAPGGTNKTEIKVGADGLYRIFVDVKEEADGGLITVVVDGVTHDADSIEGDTTWLYSVE